MRKAAVLFSKDNSVRLLSDIRKNDLFIAWEESIDDGETFTPGYSITDENNNSLFLAKSNPYYDELGLLWIDVETQDIC
jgi:hypothetical protein